MNKWARLFIVMALFALAVCGVDGATGSDMVQDIRDASLSFDSKRIPSALLTRYINRLQVTIATTSHCLEAVDTIVPVADSLTYDLPSDFYQINSAILNPDPYPIRDPDEQRHVVLDYVPPEEYGKRFAFQKVRMSQITIFGDDMRFNSFTSHEADTVVLQYYRLPTALTDSTSTIDLPAEYIPLLLDYLIIRCHDRIEDMARSQEQLERRIDKQESELIGRPADEL